MTLLAGGCFFGNNVYAGDTDTGTQVWQESQLAFSSYSKGSNRALLSFERDQDDPAQRLMADPAMAWNTFMGTDIEDEGKAVAVDSNGNIYVTGSGDKTWGVPLRAYTGGGNDFCYRAVEYR